VKGNKNGKAKRFKEKSGEGKLDYKRHESVKATIPEHADLQNSQEAETFDRHGEEKSIQNGSSQSKEISEIHRQSIVLRSCLQKAI